MYYTTQETVDIVASYERFVDVISEYQSFWNNMDEIDQRAYVLEPKQPTFADKKRLIYLDANVSLSVIVNARSPRSLPKLALIGPAVNVRTYQRLIDERIVDWNDADVLVNNLEHVLGEFPQPGLSTQQTLKRRFEDDLDATGSTQCDICYGDEEVPDETCKNCRRIFHRSCLYEWLRRQSKKQISFGTVFGQCPNCSRNISIKLANLR